MIKKKTVTAGSVALAFFCSTTGFAEIKNEEILGNVQSIRDELNHGLAMESYSADLKKSGVSLHEAQLRLAAMSDSEILQVLQGDQRQAGGETITMSVGVAVLIVLLLILL